MNLWLKEMNAVMPNDVCMDARLHGNGLQLHVRVRAPVSWKWYIVRKENLRIRRFQYFFVPFIPLYADAIELFVIIFGYRKYGHI